MVSPLNIFEHFQTLFNQNKNMNSSSIKIRMRICPKSIARTEIDLRMTFCDP